MKDRIISDIYLHKEDSNNGQVPKENKKLIIIKIILISRKLTDILDHKSKYCGVDADNVEGEVHLNQVVLLRPVGLKYHYLFRLISEN